MSLVTWTVHLDCIASAAVRLARDNTKRGKDNAARQAAAECIGCRARQVLSVSDDCTVVTIESPPNLGIDCRIQEARK